jgi:Uma2 family endonuclease
MLHKLFSLLVPLSGILSMTTMHSWQRIKPPSLLPNHHHFADVKVRLEKRNHFYYPDILVTCDDRDRETATYKSFPKLIIEVLSDSTEAFDRGDNFNDYQTLESLEEYVLVNSKHQRVETFRRGEQGLWIMQTYQQESFSLQSINLTASFRDLYGDVTLETVNYSVEEME